MIYRRGAFVAASSISACSLFFFSCPLYRTLRERRSRSPAAFILTAQLSPHARLSSLLSLFLRISPTRFYTVTPSDKPLSLPLFGSAADRSTAHFDVRPVSKRAKKREKRRRRVRERENDKFAERKSDVEPYDR